MIIVLDDSLIDSTGYSPDLCSHHRRAIGRPIKTSISEGTALAE